MKYNDLSWVIHHYLTGTDGTTEVMSMKLVSKFIL